MNRAPDQNQDFAFDEAMIADSWAEDAVGILEQRLRRAWIAAGAFAILAILLALAVVTMLPLKSTEPYTLLVDRQTGYVEALDPLDQQTIAPDAALTRSYLVQYVIARESYDYDNLESDYRKVALWSTGEARERYIEAINGSGVANPVARFGRNSRVAVEIRSVSSLAAGRSQVRYSTQLIEPGRPPASPQHWVAVIAYRFSGAEMSAADRLINPLGFQVIRYRQDAETLPEDFRELAPSPTPQVRQGDVTSPRSRSDTSETNGAAEPTSEGSESP